MTESELRLCPRWFSCIWRPNIHRFNYDIGILHDFWLSCCCLHYSGRATSQSYHFFSHEYPCVYFNQQITHTRNWGTCDSRPYCHWPRCSRWCKGSCELFGRLSKRYSMTWYRQMRCTLSAKDQSLVLSSLDKFCKFELIVGYMFNLFPSANVLTMLSLVAMYVASSL